MLEWLSIKVVSSAKGYVSSEDDSGRSLIYIRNNKGPRIEPCGTPRRIKPQELPELHYIKK